MDLLCLVLTHYFRSIYLVKQFVLKFLYLIKADLFLVFHMSFVLVQQLSDVVNLEAVFLLDVCLLVLDQALLLFKVLNLDAQVVKLFLESDGLVGF